MVKDIGQNDFEKEVLKNEKPVLVDFYATWCGPCKRLSPIIEQLSHTKWGDTYDFVKIDVDKNPQISAQYGIMSIPTLMIFKDGQLAYKQPGLQGPDALRQLLEQHA